MISWPNCASQTTDSVSRMIDSGTKMRKEIEEIPGAIQRLLAESEPAVRAAATALRGADPRLFCSVARGSSDHAASYLKYAIELAAGCPVASIGPSINSIYGVTLKLEQAACIAVSQSGQSPDITQMAASARNGGALAIAITNDLASPLAAACDHVIDVRAGREESVAATKTFVTSIVSGLLLLAHWQEDRPLLDALYKLPEQASQASRCDWDPLGRRLLEEDSLFILGRGPALGIAKEAALKFKETCQIQGEAFSAAEVLHGPVSIVSSSYPVLALVARDAAESAIGALAEDLAERGADVLVTSDRAGKAGLLPFVATGHPLTDPLMLVVSFYAFVEKLARLRGLNPDLPPHLKKVTETL